MVEHAGAVYVSEGDVVVEVRYTFRDIASSLLGKIGQRKVDQEIRVKFTPLGRPDYAPTLFSLNVGDIGSDILGCVDAPLVIKGADGTTVTFKAAGIIRPPTLRLAPNKSLYGEVEFACCVANNDDIITADSVQTITTGNPFEIPEEACDVAGIIERAATVSWGITAPLDDIALTEEGVEVTIEYETSPKLTAQNGTIGHRLDGIIARASFRPTNIDEDVFFKLARTQGGAAGIGEQAFNELLTLTHSPAAGGLTIVLQDAYVDDSGGSLIWGNSQNRIGQVSLRAGVTCDAGPPVTTVPPYSVDVNP